MSAGNLSIVGLGPGGETWMSAEAMQALIMASDLVGYETYLGLVPELATNPKRHSSGNRVEGERAGFALDLAADGKQVVLVTSGDPGIFAMAASVMQVMEASPDKWADVDVRVIPGISAMQAAAARTGAMLGHDFCVISLSDYKKPARIIEKRLEHAAKGDFVVALYNPASDTRKTQLVKARDILLAERGGDAPVVIAKSLGRKGEEVSITTLSEFDPSLCDMRTIIIIGSSKSRIFTRPDGRKFAYTPNYYPDNLRSDG